VLRSDLPLDRDSARLFLTAIIGFMLFLACLALACSMGLDNLLSRWQSQIDAAFTIELPQPVGESLAVAAARRKAVVDAVAAEPGVADVSLLSEAEKSRLLTPWLGQQAQALNLPLPDLVNVVLKPGETLALAPLGTRLAAISPGAVIDDHGRWRTAIAGVGRSVRIAALGFLLLVAGAAILTVVFVSRAGLAAHRRVIEILHLIGAHDGYIAGQFQRHALLHALAGGAAGAAAGALAFELGRHLLPGIDPAGFSLGPWQWVGLALLPAGGALLAMASARYTVLTVLGRMM